jgi:hypothetical protein
MTRSGDLSKAHEITVDIDSVQVVAAGQTGDFSGIVSNPFEAQPQYNIVDFGIAPAFGTLLVATASVTEVGPDGTPHVGAAYIYTESVQLDAPGRFVRIKFYLDWQWPLPVFIQVIIGHVP